MNSSRLQTLLAVIALSWVSAFGWMSFRLAHSVRTLYQLSEHMRQTSQDLRDQSDELVQLTGDIKEESKETDFLQGLVDVLPQEKSFLRTQRAMEREVETLRLKVGRRIKNDLHILVDTQANKLYLKRGLTLLWSADCSVGRGGLLKDPITGRRWEFVTPLGQFEIQDKIEKPLWHKPDWAFVETHEPVPPPNDPKRDVPGELGGYVLNLGDGYLIHGTKTEALLGHPVSHGCVRLGAEDLKKLYETAPRGTRVYIY